MLVQEAMESKLDDKPFQSLGGRIDHLGFDVAERGLRLRRLRLARGALHGLEGREPLFKQVRYLLVHFPSVSNVRVDDPRQRSAQHSASRGET
jgi:hypothetical protein